MAEAGERWLRPDARALLWYWVLSSGELCLYVVGFGVLFGLWSDHGLADILSAMVQAIVFIAVLQAALSGMVWLWKRHVAWRVGPEGIAVYDGNQLRRSLGWAEIASVKVYRAAVIVRLAGPPFIERLFWPRKEGAAWLRGFAQERPGDRRP